MNKLLTLGALIGLLPVTLVFIYSAVFLLVPALFLKPSLDTLLVLGILAVSTFSLWNGWRIYAIAMASEPVLKRRRLLIGAALTSLAWGVVLGWMLRVHVPQIAALLLMPGITACSMSAVACCGHEMPRGNPLRSPDRRPGPWPATAQRRYSAPS